MEPPKRASAASLEPPEPERDAEKGERPRGEQPARSSVKATLVGRSTTWLVLASTVLSMIPLLVLIGLVDKVPSLEQSTAFMVAYLSTWMLSLVLVLAEPLYRVEVGRDGVLVRRRFRKPEHIAFRELADAVVVDGQVLRLVFHSGRCVDLCWSDPEAINLPGYSQRCQQIRARIEEGIAQARERGAPSSSRAELLTDRAQSMLRRRLPPKRVPYRALPAPSTDELLGIAEADHAAPAARAAAAVVIHRSGDEGARRRLRIAADHTVHPQLRRCLRIAADPAEPAEIEAALEEVVALEATEAER